MGHAILPQDGTPTSRKPLIVSAINSLYADTTQDSMCRGENTVLCPVCQYDYVHLTAVGCEQNGTLTLICGKQIKTVEGLPSPWRGSASVSLFSGECGHFFAEIVRFHKGMCFRDWVYLHEESDQKLIELWRN